MKWYYRDGVVMGVIIAAIVIVLLCIFGGGMLLSRAECRSKAAALGLECSWGPMQGCIVTCKDGTTMAIENYGRSDIR